MGVVQSQSKVIDGTTYTTTTFPATEALDLLPRVISLVGEQAMTLLMGTSDSESDALMGEPEVVAALVVGALKRAAELPGGLAALCKDLLKRTSADKIKIGDATGSGDLVTHFDTHFAGRYYHLLEVCTWAARVGFGGP